ncbi:MAG: hypothetical protein JW891_05885 [Candidatus Lokiarchaeota archaeon]|nr:hypothetical protein [Candidatus Lokiarchaeota archaeon]
MSEEIERVKGIGPAAASRLFKAGIKTIEQLAEARPEDLAFVKGIGVISAKKIIENANEILRLEKGIEKVLEEIKNNFQRSCPKCGGDMEKRFIILGPERRISANQCLLCKFYLPI